MISSVGIVLLICAVAVNAQSQCTFVQKGETNGIPYKLDPVYLQPGTRDYKVNIPTLPQCVNREIGVTANICDEDVAPSGTIPEFNTLLVYRLGNYQHIGVVSITVYCH
ncbi:hypothetical protein HW555_003929 [Spodoptera exigua]|uniref:Uncharacterized protein n=1 Tax=Spodoptera exigua TaxID=7107 RepID=A0A835LCU2_SPOEX|nr:hypothetical protein HW555_003929 [Spodoptera exigua]